MREEERFEEETISRESPQEPRDPGGSPRGAQGAYHTLIRPVPNSQPPKRVVGGKVTPLLIRGWD